MDALNTFLSGVYNPYVHRNDYLSFPSLDFGKKSLERKKRFCELVPSGIEAYQRFMHFLSAHNSQQGRKKLTRRNNKVNSY